jgi:hypothetical protein
MCYTNLKKERIEHAIEEKKETGNHFKERLMKA